MKLTFETAEAEVNASYSLIQLSVGNKGQLDKAQKVSMTVSEIEVFIAAILAEKKRFEKQSR